MHVIVQSKSVQVTEALRVFIERQAEKLTRKGQRITTVMVFLETVAKKHNDMGAAVVKMCVSVPGQTMCVRRHANDMYQAVMDTTNRAVRALRKTKERRLQSKRALSHAQLVTEEAMAF